MARFRTTTRREFLSGQAAVDALGSWADGLSVALPAPPSLADRGASPYLLQIGRRAMACQFEVFLPLARGDAGAEAAVAALDLVDRLEEQLSVHRPDSELSRLNRSAAAGPVAVERGLWDVLALAHDLWRRTDGAFDITAGPLARAWGFFRRQGRLPSDAERAAALALVGSSALQFDAEQRTVAFQRPGLEINLGAIGKGYALDRAGAQLLSQGVNDFLLHGGASSVLAHGARPGEDAVWTIGLRHPLRPERNIVELRLANQGLGTSGSGAQYFHHQGRRYGHILDPRSGLPADGVLSSTVLAPDAATADALATAFYVLGPERAEAICAARPEWSAVLVVPGARRGAVELVAINLADDGWRVL